MKIPKTFMPNKCLEERTEELLEEKELKPKLDPKVTLLDEILNELENNPKYYESMPFHSNVFVALNQKEYCLHGGVIHLSNTYFLKTRDVNKTDLFIQVFEKNNRHYYFATINTNEPYLIKEFVDRFENYKPNKNSIMSKSSFNGTVETFYLAYLSSIASFLTYQLITSIFKTPYNNYYSFSSLTAGLGIGFVTTWLFKRSKFKKNEKQLRLLCEEFIADEKEAVKKALT